MPKPNLTFPTGLVLQAIAQGCRYGFDIMEGTGLPSGTIYPALRRLEGAGCLASEWEKEDEVEGRPPRCYYTLTPQGHTLLEKAVERFPAIRMSVNGADIPGTEAPGSGRNGPGVYPGATGSPAPEPGKA